MHLYHQPYTVDGGEKACIHSAAFSPIMPTKMPSMNSDSCRRVPRCLPQNTAQRTSSSRPSRVRMLLLDAHRCEEDGLQLVVAYLPESKDQPSPRAGWLQASLTTGEACLHGSAYPSAQPHERGYAVELRVSLVWPNPRNLPSGVSRRALLRMQASSPDG